MDGPISEVIRRKLDYVERMLTEIDVYLKAGYGEYTQRPAYRRATERLVQIIVEAAGDMSELLLEAAGKPAPDSLREALRGIRDLGVINDALFERFNRSYVGLRNRIVHDYETLDDRILFNSAKRLRKDAQAFLKAVTRYLASTRPKKPNNKR